MSKGFSLVETLVAISIFTVSLLGIMSVLASSISHTNYAKQKMIATYLAQEGIEYMRNIRDDFVLYDNWSNFKDALNQAKCDTSGNPKNCYVDDQSLDFTDPNMPTTDLLKQCANGGNGDCPVLRYNSITGKYGYASGGVDSGFTRIIQATYPSSDDIKISSTVSWNQGSGNYSVTFSEDLFNWVE